VTTRSERILAVAFLLEVVTFAVTAPAFLSLANGFEIVRVLVEIGLLALAMTPIIISGGIDLSVGALMGLVAVVVGWLFTDGQQPLVVAIAAGLALGAAGGALNASLVAYGRLPPLIVTLGTLSLFRGVAEGLTHGAVNYSGFPEWFLFLGQGYVGMMPAQLPIFVLGLTAYAVLLHRSVIGRSWYAIGTAAEGARYAGLPVPRRIALAYLLAGVSSGVAAIIYVARLGQAGADAGIGYELDAITAVVLGGASMLGGSGTMWGTLLGLLVLAILRNGLQLAALPSELTGLLTAAILLVTLAFDRSRRSHARAVMSPATEGLTVSNAQVAALCAAVLAGAALVAAANVWGGLKH
jgi:rhamnose transport system substrate-binding protein